MSLFKLVNKIQEIILYQEIFFFLLINTVSIKKSIGEKTHFHIKENLQILRMIGIDLAGAGFITNK